jgi:DNA-binding LacI/PurR family transcriptional regulator
MKSLLKKGVKIPEGILLTGSGDFGFAEHLSPSLTTFSAREDLQGAICVDSLMKFINNGAPLETHVVEPQIIYRSSTGDGVL